MMQIESNKIILKEEGWNNIPSEKILYVLTSVVFFFEHHIKQENFNQKLVLVQNNTDESDPYIHSKMFKATPENWIYIKVKGENWIEYLHQFSHEYCHHLIESSFENTNDKFGWIEEVFCELARLHVIQNISENWSKSFPFNNKNKHIQSLNTYLEKSLNASSFKIISPLNEWITKNIDSLISERYHREKNKLIAVNLFRLFLEHPSLWNTIPFIKHIEISEEMDLKGFFYAWDKLLSEKDRPAFILLKNKMVK
jgi:hypothetical protein